jgi:hypothetical protein
MRRGAAPGPNAGAHAWYGAPTRPQGSLLNDRQLGARVTVQL